MEKKVMFLVLMFVVVAPLSVSAEDCGFFCQIGEWWNDFRGENVAGKADQ